jgi:HSP20 family protein
MSQFSNSWMWSEACEMLTRAEQMHRQFFRPAVPINQLPVWEPPVDVLETDLEVLVLIALPGVAPERVETMIDGADLVVGAIRALPTALRTALIHRLELPQGRFERRVRLPPGPYSSVHRTMVDGCLQITLEKTGPLHD